MDNPNEHFPIPLNTSTTADSTPLVNDREADTRRRIQEMRERLEKNEQEARDTAQREKPPVKKFQAGADPNFVERIVEESFRKMTEDI